MRQENCRQEMSDRMRQLQQMLQRQPDDPFLLYGLAMEYKKGSEFDLALEYLARALKADPNYCYAYYQRGMVHESLGESDEAKRAYREGIAAAQRSGDAHAKEELSAALSMLG